MDRQQEATAWMSPRVEECVVNRISVVGPFATSSGKGCWARSKRVWRIHLDWIAAALVVKCTPRVSQSNGRTALLLDGGSKSIVPSRQRRVPEPQEEVTWAGCTAPISF